MIDSKPLPVSPDRSAAMAGHQWRAGLGLLLFALALPLTLLSDSLPLSLLGAMGLFGGGMIAGYQAARMAQAVAKG